jgi:hypothetical protein
MFSPTFLDYSYCVSVYQSAANKSKLNHDIRDKHSKNIHSRNNSHSSYDHDNDDSPLVWAYPKWI